MKNINNLIKQAINLHQNQQLSEAEKLYKKVISIDISNFDANNLLGVLFIQIKNYDKGISSIKKAISINPKIAWSYSNLANAQIAVKKYQDALKNCNKAISLDKNFLDAYNNRGNIFFELKKFKEAKKNYDFILSIDKNHVDAYFNLSQVFLELKDYKSAIINLQKAFEINPNYNKVLSDLIHIKMIICDWTNLDHLLLLLRKNITNSKSIHRPFPILSLLDEGPLQKKVTNDYTKNYFPYNLNDNHFNFEYNNKKIRIGYFSSDFINHPVGILIREIFLNHDRTKFEIFGFYFGTHKSNKNFK